MAKRGPQNRTTDTACLVRMTSEQRARLEAAVRKSADGKPGLKPVVAKFLLELGLAEADRILGRE